MPGEFGFIVWIIIGALAGFIASRIMGTSKSQSWLMDIVIGIIGGLVGGWILGIFIDTDGSGLIVTFLTALLGAVILLMALEGHLQPALSRCVAAKGAHLVRWAPFVRVRRLRRVVNLCDITSSYVARIDQSAPGWVT